MTERAVHAGHRERLRERLRSEGLDGFSEHEALELLLTYAIPQRDVNPLAHELITRFGSLSAVLDADESELLRVPGVGERAASLISLMPQLLRRYQLSSMGERPVVDNLASAKRYCEALFLGSYEERVYLICLDQGGRVLHPALMGKGTLDQAPLYPRDIVATALRYHAYAALLAHNHPSDIPHPSQADYDATVMAISALDTIGVRMVDHLICTHGGVYSMAQHTQGGLREQSAPDAVSYCMRSSVLPGGSRGTLRERGKLELVGLSSGDVAQCREERP